MKFALYYPEYSKYKNIDRVVTSVQPFVVNMYEKTKSRLKKFIVFGSSLGIGRHSCSDIDIAFKPKSWADPNIIVDILKSYSIPVDALNLNHAQNWTEEFNKKLKETGVEIYEQL